MFRMELDIPKEELNKIKKTGTAMRLGIKKGIKRVMLFTEGQAKKNFGGSGQLQVRSGHLRRSIKSGVIETSGGYTIGYLGSDVIYAAAHEYGYPLRNLKARPFIGPAFTDRPNQIEIKNLLMKAIKLEVDKK